MQVDCTGKEERLLDCVFPQNFGVDYVYAPYDDYGDYRAPPAVPPGTIGLPNAGCDAGDSGFLAVVCRRFEIPGAAFFLAIQRKHLHQSHTCSWRCADRINVQEGRWGGCAGGISTCDAGAGQIARGACAIALSSY